MSEPGKNSYVIKHIVLITMLCLAVYSNTLNNAYLHDDRANFVDNNLIKNWANLPKLFSKDYFVLAQEKSYRPVVTVSYFIDYSLWKLNKYGWHITNIIFHTASAVLLYLLLLLILKKQWTALAAALLFGLHPIHTEAVNIISFREDPISLSFMLLSFIFYLKKGGRSYIFSLCFFFISLFTKEMAVTLPVLLIIHDYCFNNKDNNGFIKHSIAGLKSSRLRGYLLIIMIWGLQRFVLLKPTGYVMGTSVNVPAAYPGGSFFTAMLTLPRALLYYIKLLVMPVKLSVDHLFKSSTGIDMSVIAACLMVAAIVVVLLKLGKKSKPILFSALFFIITFLPVSNILPVGAIIFERYMYFSSIGFSLFIASLLLDGAGKFSLPRKVSITIITLILALYLVKTYTRNREFGNVLTFWTKTLQSNPDSVKARNNRGCYYDREGQYEKALEDFDKAVELNPKDSMSYNNRAVVLEKAGYPEKALADYHMAIKFNTNYSEAYNNRGYTNAKNGNYDNAIADYNKALGLNPMDPLFYHNRGVAYKKKNLIDLALNDFSKSIEIYPGNPEAYYERGACFEKIRNYDMAIKDFTRAIELNPDYFNAYDSRGSVYGMKQLFGRAITDFNKAIELKQDDSKVYYSRGLAYENMKIPYKAIADFDKSIELNPQYHMAYVHRGIANGMLGMNEKSIEDFSAAIELNQEYAESYKNRSIAFSKKWVKTRSPLYINRALADINKAIELKPKSPDNYKIRSLIYITMGKKELAYKDTTKAESLRQIK